MNNAKILKRNNTTEIPIKSIENSVKNRIFDFEDFKKIMLCGKDFIHLKMCLFLLCIFTLATFTITPFIIRQKELYLF